MKGRESGEWMEWPAVPQAGRRGKLLNKNQTNCSAADGRAIGGLLLMEGCGLLSSIAGLWAAAPLAAAEFHSMNFTIHSISSFSPLLVLLLSLSLWMQPISLLLLINERVMEEREKRLTGCLHSITFYSVIWRMKFFNEGGSQQSTSLSHSINQKQKNELLFLIDSIQELVDWMGWIKNIL